MPFRIEQRLARRGEHVLALSIAAYFDWCFVYMHSHRGRIKFYCAEIASIDHSGFEHATQRIDTLRFL